MGKGMPPVGVGEGTIIQNAIVDQNARIGRDVRIVNHNGMKDYEGANYTIRDGIVVVHKDAAIPDNTVI